MSANWSFTKTFVAGAVLLASELNTLQSDVTNNFTPAGMDDASANATAMKVTADPGEVGTESLATSLEGEIQRIRNIIKEIIGGAQWYVSPALSLGIISTFKTNLENSRLGSMNRSQFTYNGGSTAYTVKSKGASYFVKDKYAHWVTELTTNAIGTPGADDWYYLYLDYSAITSGTAITATELIWSNTEPTWDDTYMGWYNGDDRCIFAAITNGGPTNIDEFFHSGDLVYFADYILEVDGVDIDTAWTDVTLTMPVFTTKANVTFRTTYVDNVADLRWRTNGQTGTTGHYAGRGEIGATRSTTNEDVITDSSNIIEIRHSASNGNTASVFLEGWHLPIGM